MYYVYVLKSVEREYCYKGLTNNIERRLSEHFAGESTSTKRFLPLRLIHVEICNDREEARKLEKFFKSGYGREVIKEITNMRMW